MIAVVIAVIAVNFHFSLFSLGVILLKGLSVIFFERYHEESKIMKGGGAEGVINFFSERNFEAVFFFRGMGRRPPRRSGRSGAPGRDSPIRQPKFTGGDRLRMAF